MATMEKFRTKLARTRAESTRSGRVVLGVPAILKGMRAGCYWLLGAVLSGAVVFGGSAPFGVALVGGAGSGLNAAAALLGAVMGYVALLGLVEGLRYVSAAILTFAVAFAFCDTKLYRAPWTMPVAAAAMSGCAGFIYLTQTGWRAPDMIYFALELGLTALFAYGFRLALAQSGHREPEQQRQVGQALLLTAVLISLSSLTAFGQVGAGRILAGAVVLFAACRQGVGAGAAWGVLLGLAMDIAGGQTPLYVMCMGVGGLVGGLCAGRRLGAAIGFVAAGAATILWTWAGQPRGAVLFELAVAAVVFMAVPPKLLERAGSLLREGDTQVRDGARDYVSARLAAAAQAFQTLHETMRSAFHRTNSNDGDTASVFDRTADKVCRGCTLRSTCWERDYITTVNALNDATGAMLRRGKAEATDFPAYFSGRCIRFREFLTAVNRELTELLRRRQYASRVRDSRRAVCNQYGQMSRLLAEAAQELGQPLTADAARQRRLRQHLAVLGLEGDGAVFYDRDHHLRLRVCGPAADRLAGERERAVLADLMGVPMHLLEQSEQVLTLAQSEPFMAVAGIAARKKDREAVSGDAGTWFKQENGQLYMLLCDGMGSGAGANRESGLAVRLLEQFLKAGVETENALTILNGALSLRGEEEGGFTTVDLLQIDLFTGRAAVWKLGAAPTYIRTAAGVRRVSANSLPAGVEQGGGRPDCTRLTLTEGDWVLMVSDGVCPDGEDAALRTLLAEFKGDSPKELARIALEHQGEKAGTDDRTVLAVRLARRPECREN
ncbi:MAG: stage II sporulation protein E [Ruminococcaceae bacterium]|nr:stage II sporulation protein E [Oscillospiraceae bacterium]